MNDLGKTVQFMDWRNGQMRTGKGVAIKDAQVTLHEEASRIQWKLSYAAIDPGEGNEQVESAALASALQPSNARMVLVGVSHTACSAMSWTSDYLS